MRIGGRAMRRLALLMGLEVLLGAGAVGLLAAEPVAARTPEASHIKVVIVVGPVGSMTDGYRALADEAADAARARTDNVVTIYSPNATWPAVRRALDGASIVVYLGHGNGWPSPYRDELYGPTQNGLGLNPVAGVDNVAHQYFGERYLARKVRLAPGAVVILGHLCYASGNPEPGGPDPSLDVAQQRADNYAAGWMAAGATAVVAEGHGRPAYYVSALLKGRGTIEHMWRAAPTFHDHVIESPSARTHGAALMLDPDHRTRGYFRSLAVVPGARIAASLAGAPTAASAPTAAGTTRRDAPREPRSPADQGARFGAPELDGRTVASSAATLTLPVDKATLGLLPDDLAVGIRWDPMIPVAAPQPEPSEPEASPAAEPSASPDASADPSESTEPDASAGRPLPDDPPVIDLIGPEAPGAEVAVAPAVRTPVGVTIPITLPVEPGLYRLVTTVHDSDSVAFDAETQDLIPALLVHVTASLSATYGVPAELRPAPDEAFTVRVRVANTGNASWSQPTTVDRSIRWPSAPEAAPVLVARWIGLDDVAASGPAASNALVDVEIEPGQEAVLDLDLEAPSRPGRYLLIFDLQTGDGQSLASMGVPPGFTRVDVGPTSSGQDRRHAHGGKRAS